MAVCGRCLLCGYKFNGLLDDGTEPDCAVRWPCSSEHCAEHVKRAREAWDEVFEHKICTPCHDVLVGKRVDSAISDLVAIVARLRDD